MPVKVPTERIRTPTEASTIPQHLNPVVSLLVPQLFLPQEHQSSFMQQRLIVSLSTLLIMLLWRTSVSQTHQDLPHFKNAYELIGHYSADYDMDGLAYHLRAWSDHNDRRLAPSKRRYRVGQELERRGSGFRATSKHKLQHDIEQFHYIANNTDFGAEYRKLLDVKLPKLYRSVLDRMEQANYDEHNSFYHFQKADQEIMKWYNRALYHPRFGSTVVDSGTQQPVPLLNAAVDFAKHERQWFGEEGDQPGIVVIDNLLSPQVLENIREYLLSSTFWYEVKTPNVGRYLGAYIADGMNDQLLMAVAYEIHKAMPRVMKDHHMKEMWSYKYESEDLWQQARTGVRTHADDAAVNVNIWITPDDANLDPDSGGLVVYTAKPPDNWTFQEFNANWEFVEENLLKPANFANVTVPYRQNRAVLFDSFLFHKTDNYHFKKGYENRRINLTILYGNREKQNTPQGEQMRAEL
jgi:phage pi2 protein 07